MVTVLNNSRQNRGKMSTQLRMLSRPLEGNPLHGTSHLFPGTWSRYLKVGGDDNECQSTPGCPEQLGERRKVTQKLRCS